MGNKIGRNEPCLCGSGRKYKKCCLPRGAILERSVDDGYQHMRNGHSALACDRWADAWNTLRPRLLPQMRTTVAAAAVFVSAHPLFDWIQDFAEELANAALHDTRYATVGANLCRHVLAQFPHESDSFRTSLRADLGQFCFLAGSHRDGEQILAEIIRDLPDQAIGYVRLADLLGLGVRPGDVPIDRPRAISLLEQALAHPVTDAADYDLELRLADMRDGTPDHHPASSAPPPDD